MCINKLKYSLNAKAIDADQDMHSSKPMLLVYQKQWKHVNYDLTK